jgi:hypothetical protein
VNGNNGSKAPEKVPDLHKQEAIEASLHPEAETEAFVDQKEALKFEELVVLDGAGRLQIPREYLELLNIGDRVRLERRDGHILVYPVSGRGRAEPVKESEPDFVSLYMEEDLPPEKKGKSLAARLRGISIRPPLRGKIKVERDGNS